MVKGKFPDVISNLPHSVFLYLFRIESFAFAGVACSREALLVAARCRSYRTKNIESKEINLNEYSMTWANLHHIMTKGSILDPAEDVGWEPSHKSSLP